MHLTAWLPPRPGASGPEGEPVDDFDLDKAKDLERLAQYLNYHIQNRRWEVSQFGEKVTEQHS